MTPPHHKYLKQAGMAGSLLAGIQTAIIIFLARSHPEMLDPRNGMALLMALAIVLGVGAGFFSVKATKDAEWIHQGFNAALQGLYTGIAAMLLATLVNGLMTGQWAATGGATPLFSALGGFIAKITTPSNT